MEGTAAEAASGSSLPSQALPSPPQHRGSTGTEVEHRCPICLDSWRDPSFVMPCLHCFCYACILQWAHNKTQCPLCKGKMTSILHSVQADDDFEEHVIIPPVTLPARRTHREPDAPNLHRPGAQPQWGTTGDFQHFVGGFQLPNWMSCFSANSAIQQTLHSWFCQSLEMLFETAASRVQHTHVPEQQHCREDGHLPHQWDSCGATGQEGSSSPLTPGAARSSVDEMPSTSSSATGWDPSTQPSASTTTHEQEPQEEPEKLCPDPPNFIRGSDASPGGPRRPEKRRASSPKGSPAPRRPRH